MQSILQIPRPTVPLYRTTFPVVRQTTNLKNPFPRFISTGLVFLPVIQDPKKMPKYGLRYKPYPFRPLSSRNFANPSRKTPTLDLNTVSSAMT